MIKISLNELIQAVPALRELVKYNFKGSLSFKIGRLTRELDKELMLFESAREEIINKYAKKNEDGTFVINESNNIELQNVEECNKELRALLDMVLEINAEKLPMTALEDIELTPLQASALDVIVEE